MKTLKLRKKEKREKLSQALLDGLGDDGLCEVYTALNHWEWPNRLGGKTLMVGRL